MRSGPERAARLPNTLSEIAIDRIRMGSCHPAQPPYPATPRPPRATDVPTSALQVKGACHAEQGGVADHRLRGDQLLQRGLCEPAIHTSREALRLDPELARAYSAEGIAHSRQDALQSAFEAFSRPSGSFRNPLAPSSTSAGRLVLPVAWNRAALRSRPRSARTRRPRRCSCRGGPLQSGGERETGVLPRRMGHADGHRVDAARSRPTWADPYRAHLASKAIRRDVNEPESG